LRSAAPVFDRTAEDGCRFRVYGIGALQVRTVQDFSGGETVLAVFSVSAPAQADAQSIAKEPMPGSQRVVKATLYVENASAGVGGGEIEVCVRCRYYAVLETDGGSSVVTEMLADGTATWEENSEALEHRNSLARVLQCAECALGSVTVDSLKAYRASQTRRGCLGASRSRCKRYARQVYQKATSRLRPLPTRNFAGHWQQWRSSHWRM